MGEMGEMGEPGRAASCLIRNYYYSRTLEDLRPFVRTRVKKEVSS